MRSSKVSSFRIQEGARSTNGMRKKRRQNGTRAITACEAPIADLPFLPDDILNKVILLLEDIADVARFSMVTKSWYKHIHSNSFWKMQPACERRILCCLSFQNSCMNWVDLPTSVNVNCSRRQWRKLNLSFNCQSWSAVAFSHGLVCCRAMFSNWKLRVFNPFKSSAWEDVPVPPTDLIGSDVLHGFEPDVLTCSMKADLLINGYIIILTLAVLPLYYLAIYDSSTRKWIRSKPVEANFGFRCLQQTWIGDSMYFLDGILDGNYSYPCCICEYNIVEDLWSRKTLIAPEKRTDIFDISSSRFRLAQSKGKLALVEWVADDFRVWIAIERKEAYALTLVFSTKVVFSTTWSGWSNPWRIDCACNFPWWVDHFSPVNDLLLVIGTNISRIYDASTNSLQSLESCPKGGVRNYYCVSDIKSFFLSPRLQR